jgi:hypothetical protein
MFVLEVGQVGAQFPPAKTGNAIGAIALFTVVKSFVVQVPGANPINAITAVIYAFNFRNKLKRLSLATLTNLV